MRKLSRVAFMSWLKSFDPKEVVGTSTTIKECPISQFLGKGIDVDAQYYGKLGKYELLGPESGAHKTPGWARKFITLIDRTFKSGGKWNFNIAGDITAARALEVLRKAR